MVIINSVRFHYVLACLTYSHLVIVIVKGKKTVTIKILSLKTTLKDGNP